ncbi:DUF6185 family protein [Streptomyces sp. NPDC007905]|uniref:MFS transporter n=1 Tax=Streptomyces sp. NPDC007905 TaxID=3364788 RepID=UPI0036EAD5BE
MTTERVLPAEAYRWRRPALAALLLGEAMNLLDATVVQVAAPTVHADLGGPVSDVQWFSTAYTLPFAVLLITGGRLGDTVGRRRLFVLGVAVFTAASVACALAPTAGLLIAFRAVQGPAAAMIIPQTIGLIKAMFPAEETAKALGGIGPVMGLAAVCGPVLGGVLTHADILGSSWRAAFLLNVPLSAVVLALSPKLLENRAPHRPTLDRTGTALAAAGTGLLVQPLIGADITALHARQWTSIACGLLVLAAFARHQRRSASPLLEPSLFTHRGFPAALVASTAFFAVTSGMTTVVVLQLQLGAHTGVLSASLSLVPWSAATWVIGGFFLGALWRALPGRHGPTKAFYVAVLFAIPICVHWVLGELGGQNVQGVIATMATFTSVLTFSGMIMDVQTFQSDRRYWPTSASLIMYIYQMRIASVAFFLAQIVALATIWKALREGGGPTAPPPSR